MYAKCFKRVMDFTLSLLALIILFPLLFILAVIGAVAMGGNPFFSQPRPGRIDKRTGKERIFKLVKFRTMSNARDKEGVLLPDDLRLNKYGRFLRSTSLDELPELWNILVGDMSIVGPRPLLVKYLPLYSEEQHHRHDVRPGLTGYAQVHGRNTVTWEDKFEMDLAYVRSITFLGDLRIIFATVRAVLRQDGISSETCVTMEEFRGSPAVQEEARKE